MKRTLTSGGAADLPAALEGKVRNLDYKTLRYPGHYAWVEKTLAETPEGGDRIAHLERRMLESVPFAEDDLVVIYAGRRRPRRRRPPAPPGEVPPHPPPPRRRPHAQGDPEHHHGRASPSPPASCSRNAPRAFACRARSIRPTSWPGRSSPPSTSADPFQGPSLQRERGWSASFPPFPSRPSRTGVVACGNSAVSREVFPKKSLHCLGKIFQLLAAKALPGTAQIYVQSGANPRGAAC